MLIPDLIMLAVVLVGTEYLAIGTQEAEHKQWVEAGIPPRAILKAMTTEAHRLLGLDGQRGFLKVGMAADLIATPANPLEDITTLKAVWFVMKNRAVVRNDAGQGKP